MKLPITEKDIKIEQCKVVDHYCDCGTNDYEPIDFTLKETEISKTIKGLLKCKGCGAKLELKPDDDITLSIKWPDGSVSKVVL